MDAGRLSTAGTNMGNRIHHREAASVQIFLHVGDNHVSFAYQNPVSSHQFQILNKGQVVQTGPADLTAIDFHRRKHCYRSNLSGSARRPFDVLQQDSHAGHLQTYRPDRPYSDVRCGRSSGHRRCR